MIHEDPRLIAVEASGWLSPDATGMRYGVYRLRDGEILASGNAKSGVQRFADQFCSIGIKCVVRKKGRQSYGDTIVD